MKDTQTWELRYLLPSANPKQLNPRSFDYDSKSETVLFKDGKFISRPLQDGDHKKIATIVLTEPYLGTGRDIEAGGNGLDRGKKSVKMKIEVPADSKAPEFEAKDGLIKFIIKHHEVRVPNSRGEETNNNARQNTNTPQFILVNLDEVENERAEYTTKCVEVIAEIIEIRKNEADFVNLCFGLGLNPTNESNGKLFNDIVRLINTKPDKVNSFLHEDSDRYYKIVINKALRNDQPGETKLLVENGNNFYYNGEVVASVKADDRKIDGLISYFKENTEQFAFLERELGFKKNEEPLTSVETKRPGRPKSQPAQ